VGIHPISKKYTAYSTKMNILQFQKVEIKIQKT